MPDADAPVTFNESRLRAGGVFVDCREAGSGLPVIFLESLGWGHRPFYEALARNFHIFILEFEDATVEGAEEAVRTLARDLAGDTYNLAGFSQGANLALRTALRAPLDPEPAESLVLLSPTAIRPAPDLPDLNWVGWADRLLAHKERHRNLGGLPFGWELARLFSPKESDADLEERLPQVQCPTLAVFGTRERMTSREAASVYRANIPNCHVSLVYDAAHLIAPDRPEAVSQVVIDFIENRETYVVNRQRSVINP